LVGGFRGRLRLDPCSPPGPEPLSLRVHTAVDEAQRNSQQH
jgi:hypothetical protein